MWDGVNGEGGWVVDVLRRVEFDADGWRLGVFGCLLWRGGGINHVCACACEFG